MKVCSVMKACAVLAVLMVFSPSVWSQTYWMGRQPANDTKVYFDVNVPEFFAPWITEVSPKGEVRKVNAQDWEFHMTSFLWDDNGSSPKRTGQIQFVTNSKLQTIDKAQWEAKFLDALYVRALSYFGT